MQEARDAASILGSGRFPGGGHGNPRQYSCLENPMDRGSWQATVHRVSKTWTWLKWLSQHTYIIHHMLRSMVGYILHPDFSVRSGARISHSPFLIWGTPRWNGLRGPPDLGLVLTPLVCMRSKTLSLTVKAEVRAAERCDFELTFSSGISWLGDTGKVLSHTKYSLFPHLWDWY